MSLHVIGLTIGDPGGIGPEVLLKSLKARIQEPSENAYVVFASLPILTQKLFLEGSDGHPGYFQEWPGRDLAEAGHIYFIDVDPHFPVRFKKGKANAKNGALSVRAIEVAAEMAMSGEIDAIVTAPISKESISMAGSAHTGHTTILKSITTSENVSMAFYSHLLKVILATIHVPLSDVPTLLTPELIYQKARHANDFCKHLGMMNPKLALAGLNPHAGEGGLFGDEEDRILKPGLDLARIEGIDIAGPISPDTVFHRAHLGEFDMVVALYHDQGLIPLKLLAFDEAVNVTLGLPFIRTSPDHGTAFDIAYQGIADPTSFTEALLLAERLLEP